MKPIYLQLSEWLETEILSGNITAGEKIYSQYQLAEMFNINPATAAKGLNILADEKILYKKRGLGMFVSPEAGEIILRKRREQVRARLRELVKEAELLDISESELITMITAARKRNKEERA
ncbi:MAG TPA: GntR family transcriptional regulator [Bacillota bacterium]|nr:GntR family transcriptional regulator [Bacillota bacterium]HPZ11411.1 GntR family transcriptional regulator [Bacillota bacterium]HQE10307.1 GntR family transcriptional regulator [Bacillota bacterium]